jgi:hypothetical protein
VDTKALNVCNAPLISDADAIELSNLYKKTPIQNLSLRKHNILKTYGERELTIDFVKQFEDKIPQYYNICEASAENYKDILNNRIENKQYPSDNTERLHKSNRDLKLFWGYNIMELCEFNNIFDSKIIDGFPYEKLQNHLIQHGENVALLFDTEKRDWSALSLDSHGKKIISKYINNLLNNLYSLRIVNMNRGKKSKLNKYIIESSVDWQKNNIEIINRNDHINTVYLGLKDKYENPINQSCLFSVCVN